MSTDLTMTPNWHFFEVDTCHVKIHSMQVSMVVFIAIIGAVVGSFLNVVILRYNTGMGFTMGRSRRPTGRWGISGLGFMTCIDIYVNVYFIREFCYHCCTNGHTALETPAYAGDRSFRSLVRELIVGFDHSSMLTAERQLVSPLRHAKFCCGSSTAPSSCRGHAFGLVFEPRYEFCAARLAIKTHYEFRPRLFSV